MEKSVLIQPTTKVSSPIQHYNAVAPPTPNHDVASPSASGRCCPVQMPKSTTPVSSSSITIQVVHRVGTIVAIICLGLLVVAGHIPLLRAVYSPNGPANQSNNLIMETYLGGGLMCARANGYQAVPCPAPSSAAGRSDTIPPQTPITWAYHATIIVLITWLVFPRLLVSHTKHTLFVHTISVAVATMSSLAIINLFVLRYRAIGAAMIHTAGWGEDRHVVATQCGGSVYLVLLAIVTLLLFAHSVLHFHTQQSSSRSGYYSLESGEEEEENDTSVEAKLPILFHLVEGTRARVTTNPAENQ